MSRRNSIRLSIRTDAQLVLDTSIVLDTSMQVSETAKRVAEALGCDLCRPKWRDDLYVRLCRCANRAAFHQGRHPHPFRAGGCTHFRWLGTVDDR